MQVFTLARAGVVGLSYLMISSCAGTGSSGEKNFESHYVTARTALEQGDYAKADRTYMALLPDSGALQPRLRLELSHSYLRAGKFAAASKEAGSLADGENGTARAAALSVMATAEHEMGLQALAKGDTKTATSYLKQAETALTEVLATNPDLDPLGSLAGRKASIIARLNGLR